MSWMYIHGVHSVGMAIAYHPQAVIEVWLSRQSQRQTSQKIEHACAAAGIPLHYKDTRELDAKSGTQHQGVLAKRDPLQPAGMEALDTLSAAGPLLLLALDGLQDPQNFGACLRVADAAGVHAVITPKNEAVGMNATVHKASAGAAETITWIQVGNMVRSLKHLQQEKAVWVAGADQQGEQSLFDADLSGSLLWLMGGEGQGLRRLRKESCDLLVRIPMLGKVESLNVSVATGICLYQTQACRQRTLSSKTS